MPTNNEHPKDRILFADDNPFFLEKLRRRLKPMQSEWKLSFSRGGNQALDILRDGEYSVVVSDIDNQTMNGEEFMEIVRQDAPATARIIMSSKADTVRLHHVADSDHFYLRKGCSIDQFVSAIREAIELHQFYLEHPRELSNQELTEVIVDYFTREILRQRMYLEDVPERIRPYIAQEVLRVSREAPDEWKVEESEEQAIIDAAWPDII